MSVNTVAGQVPQLLYSNGQLGSRNLVFLDFVGLCSRSSRRTRRRLGVSTSTRLTRGGGLFGNQSSLSVKAVLDLENTNTVCKSSTDNDIKPKVCFLLALSYCNQNWERPPMSLCAFVVTIKVNTIGD